MASESGQHPSFALPVFPLLAAAPLLAQQTGSISGKVTATDGSVLPGVTVEARSDVLPGPRVTVTGGERRVPAARAASRRLHGEVRPLRHADA